MRTPSRTWPGGAQMLTSCPGILLNFEVQMLNCCTFFRGAPPVSSASESSGRGGGGG